MRDRRTKGRTFTATLLVMLSAGWAGALQAQRIGTWFDVAAGVGQAANRADWSAGAAMNIQAGNRLASLRWDGVKERVGSTDARSALLGLATPRANRRFASIAAGLSEVASDRCTANCSELTTELATTVVDRALGVTVVGTAALRLQVPSGVAVGFTAFGNVNNRRSFTGFMIGVSGGRW